MYDTQHSFTCNGNLYIECSMNSQRTLTTVLQSLAGSCNSVSSKLICVTIPESTDKVREFQISELLPSSCAPAGSI